eukprot:Blabericola_migrator_1__12878@NODE_83_length_14926_cov_238_210041_g74_i0_p1_GENE_NODE_83_length_14926_cov_238_210041_g74_i0NODE_83_length_14926_cov_238_210041_g74_i0_p1_ORF_typecomplete_len1380_score177_27_NODE_83_length_14926_cov_238_210041_g74_i02414380
MLTRRPEMPLVHQFLNSPFFEQCFRSSEERARMTAVIEWVKSPDNSRSCKRRSSPHHDNEALLTQHCQDLMRLKRDVVQWAREESLSVILSALEAWPLVLLLNLHTGSQQHELIHRSVQLMWPFLETWIALPNDRQSNANETVTSLFQELLDDLCRIIVASPPNPESYSSSGQSNTYLALGFVIHTLSIAFQNNELALKKLQVCAGKRVEILQQVCSKLTHPSFSGDVSKVQHILLEIKDLQTECNKIITPKQMANTVRSLTPTVFILCHHIWSQGPSRLGSGIFLLTMEVFEAWTCFVSDTSQERKRLSHILDKALTLPLVSDLFSLTQFSPTTAHTQVVKWLRDLVRQARDASSKQPRQRSQLPTADDEEWKLQGLSATVRTLQMITGSAPAKQWSQERRTDCSGRVARHILAILEACICGIGKVQIIEDLSDVEYCHWSYLVKWCIATLIQCDAFTPSVIPPITQRFIMPWIETHYYNCLRDLEKLDVLSLSLNDQELSAKLTHIETSLKYFEAIDVPFASENTIGVFCNFLVDRLMVDMSGTSGGLSSTQSHHSWIDILLCDTSATATCIFSREYLYTDHTSIRPFDVFKSGLRDGLPGVSAFFHEIMQQLLHFPAGDRAQSILNILLNAGPSENTSAVSVGYEKLFRSIGFEDLVSVYEWRHIWMDGVMEDAYRSMGKVLFWRRRLLKWYCAYLWLHHRAPSKGRTTSVNSVGRSARTVPDLFEPQMTLEEQDELLEMLISCMTREFFDLETQRCDLDGRSRDCDVFGSLLSLESLYLLLSSFIVTIGQQAAESPSEVSITNRVLNKTASVDLDKQPDLLEKSPKPHGSSPDLKAAVDGRLDRHLNVLTPLLLFLCVSGSGAQLQILTRILELVEPYLEDSDFCQPPLLSSLLLGDSLHKTADDFDQVSEDDLQASCHQMLAASEPESSAYTTTAGSTSSYHCFISSCSTLKVDCSAGSLAPQNQSTAWHVLRMLCGRYHSRVLRVFASKVNLSDDLAERRSSDSLSRRTTSSSFHVSTRPSVELEKCVSGGDPATLKNEDRQMWASLCALTEFLNGEGLIVIGRRIWEDLRWCPGLSLGCTYFLARLSCRLCEELGATRQAHTAPNKPTNLPFLGLNPLASLPHDEDRESGTAWKDWRNLADNLIVKLGGTLATHRGDPEISRACLAGLFNALYIHTTQMRGYLSRVHQIWSHVKPLFTEYSLRAMDMSLCLRGMRCSMLRFAGTFFVTRFHQDIEPVVTRFLLEIALDETLQMTESQLQCALSMFELLSCQAVLMTLTSARTQITCLTSILTATRRNVSERVKEAAISYLTVLNDHHMETCQEVFALVSGDYLRRQSYDDEPQLLQIIDLYQSVVRTRRSCAEALQRTIMGH